MGEMELPGGEMELPESREAAWLWQVLGRAYLYAIEKTVG